jgi:MFS transporter, DHA3 family, macrolide efflux protein
VETTDSAPRGMRTFYTIWIGQLLSMIGSGLTSFALAVWIFQQTGRATPFALTMLFFNLPRLLLMPLTGMLADRWNRRLLMILADCGSALTTLAALALVMSGRLEVWHIYVIASANAVCSAFQEPAYRASVAMLVPKKELARASGLLQAGEAISTLVPPLLAGFLFAVVGLGGIMMIDFITFFFAVGVLLFVRIPQPARLAEEAGQKPSLRRDTAFAWRYLWQRPGLFWLVWYFALVNFLLNGTIVLLGPLVLSYADAPAYGIVQSVLGVGMLAGSIIIGAWGGPSRKIYGVVGFIALSSIGLVITGLRPSPYFAGAGMFLLLLCIPIASGCSFAISQSKIAPAVQGRVMAMRAMIAQSMMPLASLVAGPLADRFFGPLMAEGGALAAGPLGQLLGVGPGRGIGLMFLAGGVLLALVSALAWSSPRIRNIETDLPDLLPDTPLVAEPETQPAASNEVQPA